MEMGERGSGLLRCCWSGLEFRCLGSLVFWDVSQGALQVFF
jgi:hypothetical protein